MLITADRFRVPGGEVGERVTRGGGGRIRAGIVVAGVQPGLVVGCGPADNVGLCFVQIHLGAGSGQVDGDGSAEYACADDCDSHHCPAR
jgi:hypothetical protein